MKRRILLPVFFMILFGACSPCPSTSLYHPPVDMQDGIQVGSLAAVNLDSALLMKGVNKIACGKFNEVHSMLIYKDNALVLEEYFEGHTYQWNAPDYHGDLIQWDAGRLHPIMSCTKSVTSACIGIAIEKEFIESVHQSIFDYLPEHQYLNYDNREYITIEHLLTMTMGLAWDEWGTSHGTAANDIDRLYFECSDPIKCVLERPWWAAPGDLFTYNGGGMVILGEILKNASGMNIDDFSKRYLFQKLGIDSVQWAQYPNGMFDTGGSLKMTSRDMLKLGITYLNNGKWKGEEIISSDWVERSSTIYGPDRDIRIPIEDSGKNGYAYSWWVSELSYKGRKVKMIRANGWGGQTIMIFPEVNMVVVFTGGNYAQRSKLFKLLDKYILPALEMD